ncbi:MAG TPA: hypothetical protein VIM18_09650 [Solirubrobacteraceae bacterium]
MGSSVSVSTGRYVLGILALLLISGALGRAAFLIRRHFFPGWTGAPARLPESVIGLTLLVALMEILGAVGLFRLIPLVIASIAIGMGTQRAIPGDARASPRAARGGACASRERLASTAIAALAVAVIGAEWAGPTFSSYDFGIRTFDSLWYHLPWAASFAQSGQITTLHFTDVEYLTAFYPATAELFHGLGVVLFARDTLSPALNLIWLALVLLAAYCVGRPRGLGVATLLGAGLAMATPMMDLSQAGSAANDVVGVFFVLAAVAIVMGCPGSRRALVLAGLSAGLAVSVKLSMLAPVLALTVGVLVLAPPGARRRAGAAWLGPLAVAGGFWYLRNLIAVGNPLPWVGIPGLATPAAPLQAHTAFSITHYLTDTRVWHGLLEPSLASGFGPWWWAILAGALLGPVLCLLPGASGQVRMLGLVALACIVAYLLTPESAAGPAGHPLGFAFNLRYAAPALTLSLVALPLGPAFDGRRRRWVVWAALGIVLAVTLAQGHLWPARQVVGQILVGATALAAVAVVTLVGAGRLRRPLGVGLAGTVLVLASALGFVGQRSYLRSRYAFSPGVSYLGRLWAFFRDVHDARVGVVGTFGGFFAYPLFGADDSNRVQYIGLRGANGSFTPIGSCAEWRRSVNAAHLRYLVSTPARDPWRPKLLSPSPEGAWTAGDPAARVVYQRRAAGHLVTVFELTGPLDPPGCGVH